MITEPILSMSGVSVAFGSRPILDGLDLSLVAGERIALVGPNGAGKSTLLRVMAGSLTPASGSVRLSGAARRVRAGEEVQLGAAEAKPRSVEREVRRARHLLQGECLRVEAAGAVEVGNDQPDVLDAHRHDAYRNVATPTKEARCR